MCRAVRLIAWIWLLYLTCYFAWVLFTRPIKPF